MGVGGMTVLSAIGLLGAALLTVSPAMSLRRMYVRKSSADYSIPAYWCIAWGLACYCVATAGGPGFPAALISLANSGAMLAAIYYFRRVR